MAKHTNNNNIANAATEDTNAEEGAENDGSIKGVEGEEEKDAGSESAREEDGEEVEAASEEEEEEAESSDVERQIRRLLAEGKTDSYQKAEIAVKVAREMSQSGT